MGIYAKTADKLKKKLTEEMSTSSTGRGAGSAAASGRQDTRSSFLARLQNETKNLYSQQSGPRTPAPTAPNLYAAAQRMTPGLTGAQRQMMAERNPAPPTPNLYSQAAQRMMPTGDTWEDTQALGRELTPRMTYSDYLARNMNTAASGGEVTPQMQAELQRAEQADREYKERRRQQERRWVEQQMAAQGNLYTPQPERTPTPGLTGAQRQMIAERGEALSEDADLREVKARLPGLQYTYEAAKNNYQQLMDRNIRLANETGEVAPEQVAELYRAEQAMNQAQQRYNYALARNEQMSYAEKMGNTQTDLADVGALLVRRDEIYTQAREHTGNWQSRQELVAERDSINQQIDAVEQSLRAEGYSDEEIRSLFAYLTRQQNEKDTEERKKAYRTAAKDRGWLGNLGINTGTGLLSGVGYLDLAMQNLLAGQDAITGQRMRVDYNTGAQNPYHMGEATMQGEMDKLLEKYGVKDENGEITGMSREGRIRAGAYQLSVSMGQSAAVAGLTAIGAPCAMLLLSGNAATQTAHQMHEAGYSDGAALLMGAISGAAEYVTEKIGMDKLFETRDLSTAKNVVKTLLGNIVNQSMAEGGEEVLSTVINTLADLLVNQDKSELAKRYRELLAQGMTPEEAERAAAREWMQGAWQDFYMGALSGGLFGIGGTAFISGKNAITDRQTGKKIIEAGTVQDVLDAAKKLDGKISDAAAMPEISDTPSARELGAAQRGLKRAQVMENMRAELESRGEENVSPALLSALYNSSLEQEQRLTREEQKALRGSRTAMELAAEWSEQRGDNSVPAPFEGMEDILRRQMEENKNAPQEGAEEGRETPRGRTAEQRAEAERRGYQSARNILQAETPERQAYLTQKRQEHGDFLNGLKTGDKVYLNGASTPAFGVVSASENGVTLEFYDEDGEAFTFERVLPEAFTGDTAISLLETAESTEVRNGQGQAGSTPPRAQAFIGYDEETGRPIYRSNFPTGTPKSQKSARVIELIKNVWSKKPIDLVVQNPDGTTRVIQAQFDPTYDENQNIPTDASKLAGGNRHGTAKDRRVTLNLADDYYQILQESKFRKSGQAIDKPDNPAHDGVTEFHYFIDPIMYMEYENDEKSPYTVTIDVKERADGDWVYTYHAEADKENGQPAPQTLHAAVNSSENGAANGLPTDSVSQSAGNGNNNLQTEVVNNGEQSTYGTPENGDAGVRAGEQGQFPGEGEGTQPGGQGEVRQSLGQSDVEGLRGRDVTPAELGIRTGSDSTAIHIQTREEMSDRAKEAERLAQSRGYTAVPYTGSLGLGDGHANAVIQDGMICFRTDAVDRNGNPIDPVSLVEHEFTHPFTENNEDARKKGMGIIGKHYSQAVIDRLKDGYRETYKDIYDFESMSEDEIMAAIENELFGDAYSGSNFFSGNAELKEEMQNAFPEIRQGRSQTQEGAEQTRGPPKAAAGTSGSTSTPTTTITENMADLPNGRKAVIIQSRSTILRGVRKGLWARTIADHIRKTLVGKIIETESGDLIRVTDRAPGELTYGTNINELFADARTTGDYAQPNTKLRASEKAAGIIAVSEYSRWSDNVKGAKAGDPFFKDGFNYRDAYFYIDGHLYTGTVITALNFDAADAENYGEKFYDIVDIKLSPVGAAHVRGSASASSPYIIKMRADATGDKVTVAQQQRFVNKGSATYSTGDTAGNPSVKEALKAAAEKRKSKQWEILQKANPMRDDIHTGVRSVEDIRTFEEALEDDGIGEGDAGMAPDITAAMIENAKKTGEITVYSSKPIQTGSFVTPSAMEAKSYSGSGPIYSETVSTDDVAWLDSIQGQYAPVKGPGRASAEVDTSAAEEQLEKERQEAKKAMRAEARALTEARGVDIMPEEGEEAVSSANGLTEEDNADLDRRAEERSLASARDDRTGFDASILFGMPSAEERAEAKATEKAAKEGNEALTKFAEEMPDDPMDLYQEQNPVNARKEGPKPGYEKMSTEKAPEKKTLGQKISEGWHRFIRSMANEGDAIHQAGRMTGNKALDGMYFYAKAATQRAQQWIQSQRMNFNLTESGKGLNAIFDPIRAKGDEYYKNFQLYMYHMLNVERMSRSTADALQQAQQRVNELAAVDPSIATMSEEQLRNRARQYQEQGGLGYEDDNRGELIYQYWQALQERNRAEKAQNKPVFGWETGADESRNIARDLLAEHPEFEDLAQEIYDYVDALLQYRVDSGLITTEDMNRLKEMYPHYIPVMYKMAEEEVDNRSRKGNIQTDDAIKKAKGGDREMEPLHLALARQTLAVMKNAGYQQLGSEVMNEYRNNQEAMSRYVTNMEESDSVWDESLADNDDVNVPYENVIGVFKDGKRYDLTLSDDMSFAFQSLNGGQSRQDWKMMQKANDLFKKLCTAWNPLFMITNPIRDVQDALFYSTDTKRWMGNYPKAISQIAHSGRYWQMYQGMGGVNNSYFDWATGENSGKMGKIEALNMAIEQAPRLAEFMTVLQNAERKNGQITQADLMEAFNAAAEITTNFGRSGTLGKWINRNLVPFWNPGVQGLSKAVRTATETRGFKAWGNLAIKAAALGMLPALLNGLLYRDDDEWDKIDDQMKMEYYLFKTSDGVWIKVPKGRVLAALSMPVVGAQESLRGDEVEWGELMKQAFGSVAPNNPLETNLLSQAVRAKLFDPDDPGKTWYGGNIESKRLQSYAPGERYDESTDAISKWLGGKLNLSPKKINYIIDQYSGVLGDLILPYLTPKAERGINADIAGHSVSVPLSNAFMSRFTLDTVTNNTISEEYYGLLDELGYDAKGGDNPAAIAERFMNRAGGQVSDIYAQIREIENDKNLTDKEKTALTRELRKQLNEYEKQIIADAQEYLTSAREYMDQHPEFDYTDDEAVDAFVEGYNSMQTNEKYYIDADQAAGKMKDEVYREVNREHFGAEYALQVYNKDVYERARTLHDESGVSYDDYYDFYFGTRYLFGDKDAEGNTIEGTKTDKVVSFLEGMDITDAERNALYHADNHNWNYPTGITEYLRKHPEYDFMDDRAVQAFMEGYNSQQTNEKYFIDAEAAKGKMRSEAYREIYREQYGAEYALEFFDRDVHEKAQGLNKSAGLSYDDYYDFYFGTRYMTADKDEKGNSISGSKKEKVVGFINDMDITDEQKDALYLAAGYKENSLKTTPWNGGSGKYSGGSGGRGGGGGRKARAPKEKAVKGSGKIQLPKVAKTAGTGGSGAGGIGGKADASLSLIEIIDEIYGGSALLAAMDGGAKARGRTKVDFEL